MDTTLDAFCYWLADHPKITCVLICAVNIAAGVLDVVLP
jgi:hypothetical protein